MLTLYLIQTITPLALIAWLTFLPPHNVIGFWTQTLAIGVALFAFSMTGIWIFPPWWTPFLFGALLCASAIFGLATRHRRIFWPKHFTGWLSLALFGSLALYAVNEIRIALPARGIPAGHSIDLSSPLGPGVYLVANGGAVPSLNAHATFLDQSIINHRPYWGTAHGVDLVAIGHWGFRADGILPIDPRNYVIFGRPVTAPCQGEVVAAADGLADMPIPQTDREHLAGNHVILRCAGVDILLGHFRNGSVVVKVGQRLAIGDAIAQTGNSGNTSEPHLHINAMKPGTTDAPLAGAPIPIRLNGRYLVRNNRFVVPDQRRQLDSSKQNKFMNRLQTTKKDPYAK